VMAQTGQGRGAWRALRGAGYAAAALALAQLVRSIDLSRVGSVVRGAWPALPLVLVPFVAQLALEAGSWRLFLGRLGHRVRWRAALRATLGAEGVRLAFPGGAAAGDALRPALFRRCAGVPFGDGLAVLGTRKLCHLFTQGMFVAIGAARGARVFASAAPHAAAYGLETLAWGVAGALALAAVALGLVFFHGSLAERTEGLLTRATGGRFAAVLESRRAAYAALDAQFRRLLGGHAGAVVWNVATAFAGWLLDAGETFLLLRMLGAHVTAAEAITVESAISLVRAAGFAIPGGVGLQDLGYHELLRGIAGEPISAAFVLLKRARDVFWIGVSFLSRPL
jgi:Lysylphosphatidylglycerol synthase TM region